MAGINESKYFGQRGAGGRVNSVGLKKAQVKKKNFLETAIKKNWPTGNGKKLLHPCLFIVKEIMRCRICSLKGTIIRYVRTSKAVNNQT